MKYIELIQANWLTIVLLVTALIIVLHAYARLRIRLAAITPEKDDDANAKLFARKVEAFIQFFKDIFRLNKKDKKEGGFVDLKALAPVAAVVVGLLGGAVLNQKFRDPTVEKVPIPEYIEVQKDLVDKGRTKSNVSIVKEYDCPSGAISKETTTTINEEKRNLASKEDSSQASPKLDLLIGAGALVQTGANLRSIEKLTPQLAAGITYQDYGGFVASDLDKAHSVYGFRKFSF